MRHTGFNTAQRRQVADIEFEENGGNLEELSQNVDALHKPNLINRCWNCDEIDHKWQDCLQDRSIFCYGCGAKNIYKPNCTECRDRKLNPSKNSKHMGPQRE